MQDPRAGRVRNRLLSVLYWMVALMIGLGAFGHGFVGVKPVRAALDTVTLPSDVREVIWIVWYFVSGCMLTFSLLILLAWFAARRGHSNAFAGPMVIAIFWMATGIASFAVQQNPFWLLFFAEGLGLLCASYGLQRSQLHND